MQTDPRLKDRYSTPLRAVAAHGLPSIPGRMPHGPLSDDEWRTMLVDARRHRLTGLVTAAVTDGLLPATAEQRRLATQVHASLMAWALRLEFDLLQVVDLLDPAGVDLRVIKGPAVAHLDYPDPALRPYGDIDILVRASDIDTTVDVLTTAGFRREQPEPRPNFDRRFSKGATFRSPRQFDVDVHRTFVDGSWGLLTILEDVWQEHDKLALAGRTVKALIGPVRFMNACYHAALGNWPPRLASLRDVAQMALDPGFDEYACRRLARRWQAEAVVAAAVGDSWELLGIGMRTSISEWATDFRPSGREASRLGVHRHDDKNFSARAMSSVRAIPSLRGKAAFLRALVLPDPGYLDGRHGSAIGRLAHGMGQLRHGRSPR